MGLVEVFHADVETLLFQLYSFLKNYILFLTTATKLLELENRS